MNKYKQQLYYSQGIEETRKVAFSKFSTEMYLKCFLVIHTGLQTMQAKVCCILMNR